ncbi:MAG: cell wall-active antibiotics response protein [bacterium]|nr:cell wall-active antibiotics response protein [bacterium]
MIHGNDGSCCKRPGHRPWGTAILGLGLLAFGTLLTLDNVDVLDAGDYLRFWPVLLILVGLSHFLQPHAARRIGSGLIWVFVGTVILLHNLDITSFDIWSMWPLILVFFGISMLWRAFTRVRRSVTTDEAETFQATAILGGSERRITSRNFRGGSVTAIMGGCTIDLRDAASGGDPAEIDVFALFGGVEIRVPQDWEVQVKGNAVLGGMEDKSNTLNGGNKVLIITGTAIMGGVEIKN